MKVPESTRKVVQDRGISIIIEKTDGAVEEYNRRREKETAVAALHLTC
jgi:hypothetical protein